MHFVFQQSKIWESGNPVDPEGRKIKVKAKSLDRCPKQMPPAGLGRVWVLIETKGVAS